MLLKDFISGAVRGLEPLYGPQEAKSIVLMLCEACLGTKGYAHVIEPGYEIASGKQPELDAAMRRLLSGEPVQYVLGHAWFAGFTFMVDSSVLIPRPETEMLYRMALETLNMKMMLKGASGRRGGRVLDLCTGSGCLAWSLALSCPGAEVIGIDISAGALRTAGSQDFGGLLEDTGAVRPVFVQADVLSLAEAGSLPETVVRSGPFDILVSNPPYVRESEKARMRKNVLDFEPAVALFVPDADPLEFYRAIAVWARLALADDGACFVEINEEFGPQTTSLFLEAGFRNVGVIMDLCGKNRFVKFTK